MTNVKQHISRHNNRLQTEDQGVEVAYDISWKVIDRAKEFNPITKKCRLCLKEKYHIMFHPNGATLNERSEFYSTCRHRLRGLLVNT